MLTRAGRSGRLIATLLCCALLGACHSHVFGQPGCVTSCARLLFFNAPAPGPPGGGTDHYAYQFSRADNYRSKQPLQGNPGLPGDNQYTTTTVDPGAQCTYSFRGMPPVLVYGQDDAWTPIGPWTAQQTNRTCIVVYQSLPYFNPGPP